MSADELTDEPDDPGEPGERTLDDLLDATVGPEDPCTLALLHTGRLEVHGRMPWSSNGTYLVSVDDGAHRAQGIYKPGAGERPLWDFPSGLWRREVATYELAVALGWPIIPPTVERPDGPLGEGSLQFFIPSHYDAHYFTIRDESRFRRALEQMCVLDLIANNCDRKGGHVLLGLDDRVWGIDHGLSFHVELKLRTVLWDYAGERIPTDLVDDLVRLVDDGPPSPIATLLAPDEVDAMQRRLRNVIRGGVFPTDPTGRRYPWPLV